MPENCCSQSLVLGNSFLPARTKNLNVFISKAVKAIRQHPDVAADVALAATVHILQTTPDGPALRNALSELVAQSCTARDVSLRA